MQRVFRLSFVGALAIAGASLTACGDKVTVPQQAVLPVDSSVKLVTVSPSNLTIGVNSKVVLAASVTAGPGQPDLTVTWSTSNAAIATVGTDGTVTGVSAGTVTITAAAHANPNVKGAAVVTVTAGPVNTPPAVTISAVNQNPTGQPANLNGAAGQIDVVLNVDTNGQPLRSVGATITCPGGTTMTQTQTISGATQSSIAAEAAAAPITLSFNTALFNQTTGVPQLRNGACTLSATATTGAAGSTQTQTATTNLQLTLANTDGVVINNSFVAITNIEGTTQPTSANDAFGLPWHSGGVTVSALPVLYSGRSVAIMNITLPGATNNTQSLTAAPFTATWSGSAGSGPRVTGLVLVDQTGIVPAGQPGTPGPACNPGAATPLVPPFCGALEVNGQVPKGVTPTVQAIDANGNDLGLIVLPGAATSNTTFRLDNQAPEPPLAFNYPGRQSPGWVNASYVFVTTGAGNGNANLGVAVNGAPSSGSDGSSIGTENFISCGDGPSITGAATFPAIAGDARAGVGPYVCQGQIGVSAAGNGALGSGSGMTYSYYAIPAASYASASTTNGTSTSASACSITGWTKINTAGDLAAVTTNTAYAVREFEIDKLGNERCTDLAKPPTAATLGTMINTGVANTFCAAAGCFTGASASATVGVDKVAPTVVFLAAGNALCPAAGCATANGSTGVGVAVPSFVLSMSDDASGFTSLPSVTKLTRLAIDPATGAQSITSLAANGVSLFGCPIGWVGGNTQACGTAQTAGTIVVDNGSTTDGYYTFSSKTTDVARNAAPQLTMTFLVDRAAPTMGSIAVPASITGGASALFATSAQDFELVAGAVTAGGDLANYDFTLSYPSSPSGNPATANCAPGAAGTCFPIRSPNTVPVQQLNTPFSGTLKPAASFSLNVPFFIRNVATTTAAGAGNTCGAGQCAPQNNGVLPNQIAARTYDAASNPSVVNPATGAGFSNIAAATINTTPAVTNYTAPQANTATFTSFSETNAVANVSNCPAAGCAGGAAPANATSLTLTASATGTEGPAFQFLNPFTQVQFYYFDTVSNEWILIGAASAPIVTDNAGLTARTFSWSLNAPFTPPKTLGSGTTLKIIAVGVNSAGDALASPVNANTTLTNP